MSEKKKDVQGKKCFIITPIGNVNTAIFRKATGVIDSVIRPVLEKANFKDIKDSRTIFYEDDMSGVQELKKGIEDALKSIDYSKEYKDNLIYKGIAIENVLKNINYTDNTEENGISFLLKELYEKIERTDFFASQHPKTPVD